MVDDINFQELDALIGKYFSILDMTYGGEKQAFIVRYRGFIKAKDSTVAYQEIEQALAGHHLLPVLKQDNDGQILFLVQERQRGKPLGAHINLVLFILTLISVMATGGLYGYEGSLSGNTLQDLLELLKSGWPFALSLLTILGAHEFGHYFAGKKHGVQVTLPFFIPLPLSLFGTMGAFINMRSLPRDRRALFDLAISGPLSGLAVSIIALIIGLNLSTIDQLPLVPPQGGMLQMEGNSLLYLLLKFAVFGKWLPQPQDITGLALLKHWIQYFFTGRPFPWGALDVMIHPVAWAGWAGLFVTGVNLLPAGQLDGGHILYALFGHKTSQRIFPIVITALVLMGFFWNVWWMWAVLVFFLGRRHAEPPDQITRLDSKRIALGYLAIAVFILTFIPVPIMFFGG